jgi:hypothetical protein
MENIVPRFFFHHWQQKILALITAIIVWFLVNNAITTTLVIPNVSIQVENLPKDKTINSLLPNSTLKRKLTLTLKGTKHVLDKIEPGDIIATIDAANKGDEWVVHINKRNLKCLNPEIDLITHLYSVAHVEFAVKLSNLITSKIPIDMTAPIGDTPQGYQFLDIWPPRLYQTVSGPEEQIEKLRATGLELTFDLNKISAAELNLLHSTTELTPDEVSYKVPDYWKKIAIPFLGDEPQDINDPDVDKLYIDFLYRELLPINEELPIRVFYPLRYRSTFNPQTMSIKVSDLIKFRDGLYSITMPFYTKNVGRLFLSVVRDSLEVSLIAPGKDGKLDWSILFQNMKQLENEYIKRQIPSFEANQLTNEPSLREEFLRKRFRDYAQNFKIYKALDRKLMLESKIKNSTITVTDITPK